MLWHPSKRIPISNKFYLINRGNRERKNEGGAFIFHYSSHVVSRLTLYKAQTMENIDIVIGLKASTTQLSLYSTGGVSGPLKVTVTPKRSLLGYIWLEKLEGPVDQQQWNHCQQGLLLNWESSTSQQGAPFIHFGCADAIQFRLSMGDGSVLPLYRLVVESTNQSGLIRTRHKYLGYRGRDAVSTKHEKYMKMIFQDDQHVDASEAEIESQLSSYPTNPATQLALQAWLNAQQLLPRQCQYNYL